VGFSTRTLTPDTRADLEVLSRYEDYEKLRRSPIMKPRRRHAGLVVGVHLQLG
jgi:hypothetical protein